MTSPTSRTLTELRRRGYAAEVVERRKGPVKVDLAGCIDILAYSPQGGILGVQATTGSHHANRLEKARQEPRLAVWLAAGGKFEVWSWRKSAAGKWMLREEGL